MELDIRQIRITPQIKHAVRALQPDISFNAFKIDPCSESLPLNRMINMMSLPSDTFDTIEPIDVRPIYTVGATYRPLGVRLDGRLRPIYDIVNGRHRVARAILEQRKTIRAIVIHHTISS